MPKKTAADQHEPPLPVRAAAVAAIGGLNLFMTLLAAIVLGAAALFLATAWTFGPQIIRNRSEYALFTASADARIVDSWIALDLDQSRIRSSEFWRASAKASPCAIVEVAAASGDWDTGRRRAFCGPRLTFSTSYTLADVAELAPGVPFVWAKDDHGFAVPEIRVTADTRAWLAAHPAHTFMHSDWPATTELDWLMLELDQPVDQAVAGWSAPPPVMRVAFDPSHPDQPLPAGLIASRVAARPNWLAVAVLGGLGLVMWTFGFRLVPQLQGIAPVWRGFVMVLPLLTLPTWIDTFPEFLAPMSASWTAVVSDMLGDINPLDRVQATEPNQAALVNDVRIRWIASAGVYADTFGRMAPERPAGALDANAALLALSDRIRDRMREQEPAQRANVFAALVRDARRDLKAAGIVFLAAARERSAGTNAGSEGGDARVARLFLDQWASETADPHSPAFSAKQRLIAGR